MGNCLARISQIRLVDVPVPAPAAPVAQIETGPARPSLPAVPVLSALAQARWRQVCNQSLKDQLDARELLRPGARLDFSFKERVEIDRALAHLPSGSQFWPTVTTACHLGNPVRFGAVETLIRHGLIDPNQDIGGETLLQMVCLHGQNAWPRINNPLPLEHRITSLIALGAKMEQNDLSAASLLQLIWEKNDPDGHLAAAALITHGCDPLQRDALHLALLDRAADRGIMPVLRGLQKAGLALDRPLDDLNSTALHLAAEHGYNEILRFLVTEGGVGINAADENSSTALHYAVENFNFETVKTLLEMQANPNCVDIDGISPLMIAESHRSEPLRTLLVQHGATPDIALSDH